MKKLFVLLPLFSFSVFAEDSYLEVVGIASKASSANSLVAKSIVFSNALNRAFGRVLRNYFPEAKPLEDEVSEKDIQDCLYDYSIDREKFSGTTYIARFSFRFSKDAVTKMLRRRNAIESKKEKFGAEMVAVYTQDYLDKYDLLKDYKVIVASPKRVIFEIPTEKLRPFLDSKVAYAKVNAKISS